MCGIAGAVGRDLDSFTDRMVTRMRHRGPDGQEVAKRGSAQIGMCLLSIIDPEARVTLLSNASETITLAFNGEIYNYRELRKLLEAEGHRFKTRTDTEVVLNLYEEYGIKAFERLRGMFSLAIVDGNKLVLARDRLGIKPLYLFHDQHRKKFLFASEIKAILQCEAYQPELDLQTFADFIVINHATGTRTFFSGISTLAPGHYMVVTIANGAIETPPNPYYDRNLPRTTNANFNEALNALSTELRDAVVTHLDADVEVALTLSGGLDSTLLGLFAARQTGKQLRTFSVAESTEHADYIQANLVSRLIGSNHSAHCFTFDEYLNAIPDLIEAEEAPSSLWGMPIMLLCRNVAQHTKACLHGEGADELFGGYKEYIDRRVRAKWFHTRLPLLRNLGIPLTEEAVDTIKRQSLSLEFDSYLENVFEINLGDQLQRFHLDPVDKYGMAASLEMRVPFLDDRVYEVAARLPLKFCVNSDLGIRKYILRHLAIREFGPEILDVVLRQKLGAPSSGSSMLTRFESLCEEVLPDKYVENHKFGCFFIRKRELLMFDMFTEYFIENRASIEKKRNVFDFLSERTESRSARQSLNNYSKGMTC
jgi:asparagine synthase (glutamine-hydrolysing)